MSGDWEPGHRDAPEPDRDEGAVGAPDTGAPDAGRIAWLVVGGLAIAAGTALGWNADALSVVVTPPATLRAALVGVSVAIGVVLLLGALDRLAGGDGGRGALDRRDPDRGRTSGGGAGSPRDIAGMIRGVRLVFLAVAAFAAGSGWLLGHPLPLVVALVIAGVDVLETSFLLIVVGLRTRR